MSPALQPFWGQRATDTLLRKLPSEAVWACQNNHSGIPSHGFRPAPQTDIGAGIAGMSLTDSTCIYRCNSKLGLSQILCNSSRLQQYPHSACLADRIYAGLIHSSFPAGGPYNVDCGKYGIPFIGRSGLLFIQGNDACRPLSPSFSSVSRRTA